MASSRMPLRFVWSKTASNLLHCSAVSQFPARAPCFFARLTRRMPAAKSGLSKPASDASYARRRTAANLRLIVEEA